MKKTIHFSKRQSSRGISNEVVNIVWVHGDFIGEDEIYMSKRAISDQMFELRSELWGLQRKISYSLNKGERRELGEQVSRCKRSLHLLEKSGRVKLAVIEDIGITCMHARGKGERNLLLRKKNKFTH
jgi:hypothetical protein